MPWVIRKPSFEKIVDFLTELPIIIVESILKMSINRSNYKALKYAIGSGSTSAIARNEVLKLMDRITSDKEFLRKQLMFDIQLNYMIEEDTTHGNREWNMHKFIRLRDEFDQVKDIMFGYECIQYLRPQSSDKWDNRDRTTIIIINFWKMYSHSRDKNIVQDIINAVRLITKTKKVKNTNIHFLSFKTDIICKEKINVTDGRQVDLFLRMELIANNYVLLGHVDRIFYNGQSDETNAHTYMYESSCDKPQSQYRCVCPHYEKKGGNCGTMWGWTLVSIIRRGRFYSGDYFYFSSFDDEHFVAME